MAVQTLYSWGANSHGQLGLGFESELCMTPQKIGGLPATVGGIPTIACIKGGGGHVLILDNRGRLFSCGWNNKGQLGLGVMDLHVSSLKEISLESFEGNAIVECAAGWDTSGAITRDGRLYLWGSNSFQQLGLCKRGFSHVNYPFPIRLPKDELPVKLSLGLRHCVVLTEENVIYVFGRLRLNEAPSHYKCTEIHFNRTEILKIIPSIQIKLMSCGQNHLLLSDGHRVIGIGENKYGQANNFYREKKILHMTSGWTHNGLLVKSNEVFLWGRNTYGQIGRSGSEACPIPTHLNLKDENNESTPEQLELGAESGIIKTCDGRVLCWGWNEHGNCGNGSTDNLFQSVQIKLPAFCVLIGAGAGFCYAVCEESEN